MRIAKRKASPRFLVVILGLVALTTGVIGCSNQSPLAPTPLEYDFEQAQKAAAFADSVLSSAGGGIAAGSSLDFLKDSEYYLADAADKLKYDAEGGELELRLDGEDIVFVVPEGAVDSEVEIVMAGFKMRTPFGDVYFYECGPSGLEFDVPIQVNHPVDKLDGQAAGLIFIDDDGRFPKLELEQVSPVENGKVLFQIHHFSKYAIS